MITCKFNPEHNNKKYKNKGNFFAYKTTCNNS